MDILSKLPERLRELMVEKEINAPKLAKAIGVNFATINRYLEGIRVPKFDALVALADYFNCSTDFLLGLTDYPSRENQVFKPVPPFYAHFKKVLESCGFTQYALQKKTGISWANFNDWLHGRSKPLADNLIKIATALGCSVDFLIGREN